MATAVLYFLLFWPSNQKAVVMTYKKRESEERGLYHIYQRTKDKHILFRCLRDHLVYHTLFYEVAQGRKILCIAKCQMPTHFHILLYAKELKDMVDFMKCLNYRYSRAYNSFHNRTGNLLKPNFGSSLEENKKKALSAIAYVYNNPVVPHFCSAAEQYRWNLLPYARSKYPCSTPIIKSHHNYSFNQAIKLVDSVHVEGKHLNYQLLTYLFNKLGIEDPVCWGYKDPSYNYVIGSGGLCGKDCKYRSNLSMEQEQFIDYIISIYNCIDFERIIKMYGGYEKMLYAFSTTTGSEFGLNEDTFI